MVAEVMINIQPTIWYQDKTSLKTNIPKIKLVIGSKVLKIAAVEGPIDFMPALNETIPTKLAIKATKTVLTIPLNV